MPPQYLASVPSVEAFTEPACANVPHGVRNVIRDVGPAFRSARHITPLRAVTGDLASRKRTSATPAATRPAVPIKRCAFCAEPIHAAAITCTQCDRDQRFW
jgi:hypothetical protein